MTFLKTRKTWTKTFNSYRGSAHNSVRAEQLRKSDTKPYLVLKVYQSLTVLSSVLTGLHGHLLQLQRSYNLPVNQDGLTFVFLKNLTAFLDGRKSSFVKLQTEQLAIYVRDVQFFSNSMQLVHPFEWKVHLLELLSDFLSTLQSSV